MSELVHPEAIDAYRHGPHQYRKLKPEEAKLPGSATFYELIELYFKHMAGVIAPSTEAYRRQVLFDLAAFAREEELTVPLGQAWINDVLARGLKNSTVNKYLRVARTFGTWMTECGYATRNSFLRVRSPAFNYNRAQSSYMTHGEFVTAHREWQIKRPVLDYLLVMMYFTGLRISDACLLQRSSVDLESGLIRYTPFKTRRSGRDATIKINFDPLFPNVEVARTLIRWMEEPVEQHTTGAEFVCPEAADLYLKFGCNKAATYAFSKQLRKLGINRSPHSCRRSFCSVVASFSDISPMSASKLTGQSVDTFQKYVTPDDTIALEAVRRAFKRSEQLWNHRKNQNIKAVVVRSEHTKGPVGHLP